MEQILKAARVEKQAVDEGELSLINRHTLVPLTADGVFAFRMNGCDNLVDRDYERFTDNTLEELAPMYVGRTVLMDHVWSAQMQTARVYDANVEDVGGGIKRLVLRCYMPRAIADKDVIAKLESGILKECSVGCMVERVVCSICGADQTKNCCEHVQGLEYDGQLCVMELDGAKDAYEVSLVAVPAQPAAGVIKSKRYGGAEYRQGIVDEPGCTDHEGEAGCAEADTMLEKLATMARKRE